MCQPASFIVTVIDGDYVCYWSEKTDSHNDIINEFNLKDVPNIRNEPRLIPCDIVPPDNNYKLPIKKWIFQSDIKPSWADMQKVEEICHEQLKNWYKCHVIKKGKYTLKGNISRIILGGEIKIENQTGGDCRFCGNSQGKVSGQTGGDCRFWDNSQGKVSGQTGGECRFWDNSQGKVSGQIGGACRFYGNSQGKVSGQTGGECRFLGNSQEINELKFRVPMKI